MKKKKKKALKRGRPRPEPTLMERAGISFGSIQQGNIRIMKTEKVSAPHLERKE